MSEMGALRVPNWRQAPPAIGVAQRWLPLSTSGDEAGVGEAALAASTEA